MRTINKFYYKLFLVVVVVVIVVIVTGDLVFFCGEELVLMRFVSLQTFSLEEIAVISKVFPQESWFRL